MKWLLSIAIVLLVAFVFSPRSDIATGSAAPAKPNDAPTPAAANYASARLVFVPLERLNPFPTLGAENTTRTPKPVSLRARAHFPKPEAKNVSPDSLISTLFDEPMNPASVETRFQVTRTDNGAPVDGYFEWQGNLLFFYPVPLLENDTTYEVRLNAGAETRTGDRLEALDWKFSTGSTLRLPGAPDPGGK